MFKSSLKANRHKEQLTLSTDPDIYVSDEIVQYLLTHQINGIRFLYRNYKKHKSSILNDESGAGKCFQCIAFFDAILRATKSKILVICQRKQSVEHWQYHTDCFLKGFTTTVADNKSDTQQDRASTDAITIASLDHVLTHIPAFTTVKYDCVVLQDQQTHISVDAFERLKQIKTECKIILCSNDLMDNLTYFYEVLKFCDQLGPLAQKNNSQKNNSMHTLTLDEFKQKFGCSDKSVPKRNIMLRQKTLLNACSEFYLRRLCHQFGSQFPPIKPEDFQIDFEAWKNATIDTEPLNTNALADDSSLVKLLPNPNNQTISSVADVSLLNTACTDFSDFDTQMSPLVYSDSEHDDDDLENQIQDSQNDSQRFMTPEIVCNQEHAAKTRAITKEPILTRSQTTPIKRTLRSNSEHKSPACKRLNYKQLPIKFKSNGRIDLSRTYLFRSKKQPQANSTVISESQRESRFKRNTRERSTSSTSDVQIISQKTLSPIVISTSEDDRFDGSKDDRDTKISSSPDLFSSFTSARSQALSQQVAGNQKNPVEHETQVENDTFREVFGAPDECDDIDLLSNTNVDIFEITKNSVFDNVLCSADDKITPLKRSQTRSTQKKSSPSMNCLSGLRVILPRLNNRQVEDIQNELSQSQSQSPLTPEILSSSEDVIDLTAHESQKIIEINSDDSVRNREKTPERKQELTPSTRSCLKRHAGERSATEERRKKSPYARLGWLTTTRTSPRNGDTTPQSRRRLDKWRKRTDESNLNADDVAKVTKPRNLFNEFKSKSKPSQKSRYDIPSTSTAKSPTLFSSQE